MRLYQFRFTLLLLALVLLPADASRAASRKASAPKPLSAQAVKEADWSGTGSQLAQPLLVKLQILLDRAHASPGEIDGNRGENTRKAVAAFREMRNLGSGQRIDRSLWQALAEADPEAVLIRYTISDKDVAGPFIDRVPEDYREKASLKHLSYTSPQELLAEKFHMSEQLLRQLNPEATFDRAGTELVVVNVERDELPRKIARVEVDAAKQQVLGYDKDESIVVVYPATVGSAERPSPMGESKVTAIAKNPTYHYDPSLNLRGVHVQEKLELPPGPNNPVGLVWISLSAKGYGIHGTPDPGAVSKRASHGCIRLTNWDALELAKHVGKGTPVAIERGSGKNDRLGRL